METVLQIIFLIQILQLVNLCVRQIVITATIPSVFIAKKIRTILLLVQIKNYAQNAIFLLAKLVMVQVFLIFLNFEYSLRIDYFYHKFQ